MRSALLILLTAADVDPDRLQSGNTVPDDGAGDANGGSTAVSRRTARWRRRQHHRCRRSRPSSARLMQQLVVYFEYDEAEILPEFNALLQAHGQFLARNPNIAAPARGPRRRARQPRVQHRPRRAPLRRPCAAC